MCDSCKHCRYAEDRAYLASVCHACANGQPPPDHAETGANVDENAAAVFKGVSRWIGERFNFRESMIIWGLIWGYSLAGIAEEFGMTRANVAAMFKAMRQREPSLDALVEWTPHGGAKAAENEPKPTSQGELFA